MPGELISWRNVLILGIILTTFMNVGLYLNLNSQDAVKANYSDDLLLARNHWSLRHLNNETKDHSYEGGGGGGHSQLITKKDEDDGVKFNSNNINITSIIQTLVESTLSSNKTMRQGKWGLAGSVRTSDDDTVINLDKGTLHHATETCRLPPHYYPRAREVKYLTRQEIVPPSLDKEENDGVHHTTTTTTLQGEGERIAFFLHVHKSGGTQVCHLAKFHNWTDNKLPNCNLPGLGPSDIHKGWFGRGNLDDVNGEGLYAKMKQLGSGYKMAFCEVVLTHQLNVNKFLYAMNVRKPMNRMKSHFRMHSDTEDKVMLWTSENASFYPKRDQFGRAVTSGTAAYDNTLLRYLTNPDIYTKLPRSLSEADFQLAAETLKQFEIIIILERYEHDSIIQFPRLLGWHAYLMSARMDRKNIPPEFSDTFLEYLDRLNHFDNRLYILALELSNKINEKAFALNPPLQKADFEEIENYRNTQKKP
jgi:hypothetical protein